MIYCPETALVFPFLSFLRVLPLSLCHYPTSQWSCHPLTPNPGRAQAARKFDIVASFFRSLSVNLANPQIQPWIWASVWGESNWVVANNWISCCLVLKKRKQQCPRKNPFKLQFTGPSGFRVAHIKRLTFKICFQLRGFKSGFLESSNFLVSMFGKASLYDLKEPLMENKSH